MIILIFILEFDALFLRLGVRKRKSQKRFNA